MLLKMDSRLRGNDIGVTRSFRVIPVKTGIHVWTRQLLRRQNRHTSGVVRSDRRMNLRVSSKSPGSPKGLRKTVRTAPTMAA